MVDGYQYFEERFASIFKVVMRQRVFQKPQYSSTKLYGIFSPGTVTLIITTTRASNIVCISKRFCLKYQRSSVRRSGHSYCGQVNSEHQIDILYRVSQEECARLREGVPYAKIYRYNPKHLCPKWNGYGDNGQRSLKL